jgi:hypothetical protein
MGGRGNAGLAQWRVGSWGGLTSSQVTNGEGVTRLRNRRGRKSDRGVVPWWVGSTLRRGCFRREWRVGRPQRKRIDIKRRPPAAKRRQPRRGLRSKTRRHPLTSPWKLVAVPSLALHGTKRAGTPIHAMSSCGESHAHRAFK